MEIHEQPTNAWQGNNLEDQQTLPQDALAPGTATGVKRPGGLSRRKLFFGLTGAGVAVAGGGIALEQWLQHNNASSAVAATDTSIGHLLRRAGFGATASELATYKALGYAGTVERLLNYQQVPDDALENRLKALNLDLNQPQNQQHWWLLRMAGTQRPLLEKMTLFWHGHFVSSFRKVGGKNTYMRMINQNNFLRNHAFDTFDNLLTGITADPAMLFYLDLTKSRKNAPNENYARELMELFTLGLGHYTQQDVYEAAAALTGWHIVPNTDTSRYYSQDHSDRTKVFLGQTGNFDYKDIIRILANHPATPWFLAHKLFTFFVYENPSNADLQPLVDSYVKSQHNMGEVMRTLLLSPQFSSEKAYRSRVKSPTEFVVGVYRGLNIQSQGKELPLLTTLLGQPLFDPPNVAGWPADKVSALWLNSGAWMGRLNYLDQIMAGVRGAAGTAQPINMQDIVNANHIDSAEHFVDHFTSFLLDGSLPQDRRAQVIDYINVPVSGASTAIATGKANKAVRAVKEQMITFTGGKSYPLSRVHGALYLLMATPEYQLN